MQIFFYIRLYLNFIVTYVAFADMEWEDFMNNTTAGHRGGTWLW